MTHEALRLLVIDLEVRATARALALKPTVADLCRRSVPAPTPARYEDELETTAELAGARSTLLGRPLEVLVSTIPGDSRVYVTEAAITGAHYVCSVKWDRRTPIAKAIRRLNARLLGEILSVLLVHRFDSHEWEGSTDVPTHAEACARARAEREAADLACCAALAEVR